MPSLAQPLLELPQTTDSSTTLEQVRSRLHPRCFVCGPEHPGGLRVDFHPAGDGVVGVFSCAPTWEGVAGRIHGGVLAALLDGAMSNCLLALGVDAVTADFHVRYRRPVRVGVEARVEAHRCEQRGPLHDMEAVLLQDGQVMATARARFYDGEASPWP